MNIQKLLILVLFSLLAGSAAAQPVRCSPGYQDASCVGVLYNPVQIAPTCSSSAGWVTVTPAQWIGSRYSTPACSYTPPPTCPPSSTQTGAPNWNGAAWTGLQCQANTPPSPLNASAGLAGSYGYFSPKLSAAGSQTLQIRSDGTWSLARSGFSGAGLQQTGSPTSGTWTSDATQVYEYTITQANHFGIGNYSPTALVATWTTLSNLAFTASTPGGGVPEEEAIWVLNIRQRGTTSPVLTFHIDLDTANGD